MNEKLKPCPFCGHEAKIDYTDLHCRDNELYVYWSVVCPNCATFKNGGYTKYYLNNDETLSIKNNIDGRNKAIEEWNRRAENG